MPAGHHGLLGGAIVFFGVHPKTQRRFVVQSIEGGGWGGRPSEDGVSGTVSVCQGDVRNASIEGIELKCPVLVEGRALRTDSAGAGKHRGGLGIDTSVRNLVEGRWNFDHPKRAECPPWGLWGGTAGATADFLLRKPGENDFRSMDAIHYPVPVDSEVIVRTGGGGGWGNPLDRDVAAVRADVIEEFVSRRFAEETYGVVLRDDLTLDEAADRAAAKCAKIGPRITILVGGTMRSALTFVAAAAICLVTASAVSAAELIRVGNAGRESFSFTPANIGKETGIFAKHGLDLDIAGFGGDAKLQQAMAADAVDIGLGSGPGTGLHRQGLAGQGHRRHGGTAADLRHGGARRRLGENRRRPQGPQGRHLHRRLGDQLADERGVAPARLGL